MILITGATGTVGSKVVGDCMPQVCRCARSHAIRGKRTRIGSRTFNSSPGSAPRLHLAQQGATVVSGTSSGMFFGDLLDSLDIRRRERLRRRDRPLLPARW